MNQFNTPNFTAIKADHAKLARRLPRLIGSKAVSFFKGNFRRRGFPINGRLQKWAPRQLPDYRKGGALLVKSGRLRRSIRTTHASDTMVKVGTDVPYAKAHNEGADIKGTAFVPSYQRKAHKVKAHTKTVFGRRVRVYAQSRQATTVKGHQKQMNTKIVKRKFIGHSPDLMKSIEREYKRKLKQIVTKNSK